MFLAHEVIMQQSRLGDSTSSASDLRSELTALLDAAKKKEAISAAASFLEQTPHTLTNAEAAEAAVLVKATTRLPGAMEAYSDYIWAWLEHLESGAELHVEHCELGILLAQLAARPLLQWEKTLLAAQLERALAAKLHIPAIKQLLLDFEKADAVPHGGQRWQASVDAAKTLLQKHQEDQVQDTKNQLSQALKALRDALLANRSSVVFFMSLLYRQGCPVDCSQSCPINSGQFTFHVSHIILRTHIMHLQQARSDPTWKANLKNWDDCVRLGSAELLPADEQPLYKRLEALFKDVNVCKKKFRTNQSFTQMKAQHC